MDLQFALFDQELDLIVESRGVIMVQILLAAVNTCWFIESMGGMTWFVLEIVVHHVLVRIING
jgi:hypothetical protein